MCFDVPKVVRCPGFDHGHDEESRNGRDIKIDILEAYIWISELFRVKSGFYRSTGRLPEPPPPPGGVNGPTWAMREKRRAGQGRPRAPSLLVRIGQGRGGLSSFCLPPSFSNKARGGSPTPGGSRTPPGAPLGAGHTSPLPPLYTGARGHPMTHKLIFVIVP